MRIRGERNPQTQECRVWLDEKLLSPKRSQSYRNHSPTGFEWGYGGSGPAQLALAILLEATDPDEALRHYQQFKFKVIGGLPKTFNIEIDVREWLKANRKEMTPT